MVDYNHALHTREALHGFTAIKFCVKLFYLGFGGPSALGALGCSHFSPLGNPGLKPAISSAFERTLTYHIVSYSYRIICVVDTVLWPCFD